MSKKYVYRRILIFLLALGIIGFAGCLYIFVQSRVPDKLRVIAGREQNLDVSFPVEGTLYEKTAQVAEISASNIPKDAIHINLQETLNFTNEEIGSYVMDCKLFGFIDLKQVDVEVIDEQSLIPCGVPIGIYVETDGVLVVGTGPVKGMDGLSYEPAQNIVRSGDYIISINGKKVSEKAQLIEEINNVDSGNVVLGIVRNHEEIEVKIKPVQTGKKEYKLGIWVRDNTQGIGMLTYIDGNNCFGALGHGINDVDTSTLMEINGGKVYETKILSVIKGEKGTPGELVGMIDYENGEVLGEINKNTGRGIFGSGNEHLLECVDSAAIPIGLKQDVKTGKAVIRSCINGQTEDYEIEITEVNVSSKEDNKGIVLKVTDERLLNLTGGIVQGMSGSPIIQNGQIVGAVTHVLVNDPTKGYGIFIEIMLEDN